MEDSSSQPKRRPRVSLLSLLLLVALVATSATAMLLWREVKPLRQEVARLRVETGRLSIDDPKKAHAVAIDTIDEDTWKWRVYLPEGHDYRLATKIGQITGRTSAISQAEWFVENGSNCSTTFAPGEYTITVQLQNDPTHPNGESHWNVQVRTRQQRGQHTIGGGGVCGRVVEWLADRRGRGFASDVPRNHEQHVANPRDGIELLTLRPGLVTENATGWSIETADFTKDGEGIGVWIVCQ